jgi:SAM-dependent methyltransferase
MDLVYSVLVLQHVAREDAFCMLRDVRRVLRPGGTAYLTFPNILDDGYLAAFVQYAESGEVANPARARFYTPAEVGRVVGAAGFADVSVIEGPDIVAVAPRPE